jgi:hypothetical protein
VETEGSGCAEEEERNGEGGDGDARGTAVFGAEGWGAVGRRPAARGGGYEESASAVTAVAMAAVRYSRGAAVLGRKRDRFAPPTARRGAMSRSLRERFAPAW